MKNILLLLILILSCEEPVVEIVADGYLHKMSYYVGEKAQLYINAKDDIDNCKVGIYNIDGVLEYELITSIFQQSITNVKSSELGYGYELTTEFEVPDLVSGIYLVENKIPFIIKTTEPVDAIVLYPSNTINAYSDNGGSSFYAHIGNVSPILSFIRPQNLPFHRQGKSIEFYKWLSLINYNFGYLVDYDLGEYSSLLNSNIIIISGHSEYWSRNARENFDQFIDAGNDAMVLSGNTMWWQIRYAEEGSKLIGYKYEIDPIDNTLLKTINWFEPELDYSIMSSIGVDFRYGGYGLSDQDDGWDGYKIVLPDSPLFLDCNLSKNQIISIPTAEYDGIPIEGNLSEGTPIVN